MGIAGGGDCSSRTCSQMLGAFCNMNFALNAALADWLFAPKAIADELAGPPCPIHLPTSTSPTLLIHHNPNSLSSATFPQKLLNCLRDVLTK